MVQRTRNFLFLITARGSCLFSLCEGVSGFHICLPRMYDPEEDPDHGSQIKAIQEHPVYKDITYPGYPGAVSAQTIC